MPSATPELRTKMKELFGSEVSDAGPMRYLESLGYTLKETWHWKPPIGVKSYAEMPEDAYLCVCFLVQEWDMAGVEWPEEEEDG